MERECVVFGVIRGWRMEWVRVGIEVWSRDFVFLE